MLAHLQNDSTVCDCGIGSAAFSLALAKAVPVRLKITEVDISSVMVSIARQNLDRAGVNACIKCRDVRALQFEDNTFF